MRFGSPWSDTLLTLDNFGFEKVWETPLSGDNIFIIAAHRTYGILLTTHSLDYAGIKCTGRTKLFFHCRVGMEYDGKTGFCCSKPAEPAESGVFIVHSFSADDLNELKEGFEKLHSFGHFVSPWPQPELIWLLSYEDEREVIGRNYIELNAKRLAELPDWVQKFVVQY